MGYCAKPTTDMGEYSVEVRSESFILRGEDSYLGEKEHGLFVWAVPHDGRQGSVEILLADIPKIRAALDQAERINAGHKLSSD
jgi:hypothetical protein